MILVAVLASIPLDVALLLALAFLADRLRQVQVFARHIRREIAGRPLCGEVAAYDHCAARLRQIVGG